MLPRQGVTQDLARFVVETKWQDLPEQARHEAKRALLNFFAVAIAGCRTEPVELALRTLGEFSGGRQASIVGRSERIDPLTAAFLNAAGANVFDYCDTHLPTVIHPTAPVAPALLALSEMRKVSGPEFLLAFVLGVEIECRVGNAISPGHYPKGWHITSTCGVFGSATGAAKLLGLDAQRTVWALGSAATQSAGLCECLGWPAKSVSVGNAARNGLFSALLAEKGFSGPAEPLAGAQGFLAVMGEPPDWAALLDGLGKSWQVANNSLKPYPSGFVIHPLLDLALDWRRAHPGLEVERVDVRGNPLLLQRANRAEIATGREAQVSLQHCVAAALILGKAGLDQLTDASVADPRIKALRTKFACKADPAISTIAAEMDIWTTDGRKHALSTKAARGSVANPLKDTEIEAKLRDEAARWEPGHDVGKLIDAVWSLEKSDDVSTLVALTRP
ncbi:MAG: MmgE/PrpD family protein [Reyranella sp.]|nr:MAG: MmgE/PrpD family protein [Reyranella sp.]